MAEPHELSLVEAVQRFLADFDAAYARGERRPHVPVSDLAVSARQLEAVLDRELGTSKVQRQPYKRTARTLPGERGYTEHHESYGTIQFSRVSGHAKLYGSAVEHQHFLTLTIKRGQREITNFGERFYAGVRAPIVEVWLTASQFAEAITLMNYNDGVPCTIHKVDGVMMDPPPADTVTEMTAVREDFAERIQAVIDDAKGVRVAVDHILEKKKTLTREDKDGIRQQLVRFEKLVADSAPFALKMFQESAEKTITKAKTEVESFVTAIAHRLGVERLEQLGRAAAPPELQAEQRNAEASVAHTERRP